MPDPSTAVGPEPVRSPLTGHTMDLDLAATGEVDLVPRGLRAEVIRRGPTRPIRGAGFPAAGADRLRHGLAARARPARGEPRSRSRPR
ncbi:hypothetical protein [Streptomyces lacrimifluminis]|uniref:hypothetical protein n=1 Tax=Streptomyces lacrimifluminis TaxID=1500077 RepID=UPI00166E2963|nr:hypothetical protein [Streptomyces lacrimifluminis]